MGDNPFPPADFMAELEIASCSAGEFGKEVRYRVTHKPTNLIIEWKSNFLENFQMKADKMWELHRMVKALEKHKKSTET